MGRSLFDLLMGSEDSRMVDDSVKPKTLTSRTVKGIAEYVKSGKAKKVVVMTGAGISTSAGIPDFRSPDTGLYANLARLNLPFAEAVFEISYFRRNPDPFYTLAHELYPGKYRPTVTHSFIKLLHTKNLLTKHFTQNIDCLDREAGVPGSHIIEAHGSFARQSCIECREPYPDNLMKEAIDTKTPPHCLTCQGLVKPDIVFFGEALPSAFWENRSVPLQADLCIVMGTSLTVQPFASLPNMIREGVPRVLINKEPAGGIGSRPDDVLLIGDCDEKVRELADACGWREELEGLWQSTKKDANTEPEEKPKTKDEEVESEVDKLTKEVDKSLSLSEKFDKDTREETATEHMAGKTEKGDSQGPQAESYTGTKSEEDTKATEPEKKAKDDPDSEGGGGNLGHVYPHIKSNLS